MAKVVLPTQDGNASSAHTLFDDQGFSTNDLVEVRTSTGSNLLEFKFMQCMIVINAGLGQGVLDQERFVQHPTGL